MEGEAVLELAVELGYQILLAGGEIYRVEESISRVLKAYGLETGEVFAIPNCIIASITTPEGESRTQVRRIPSHGTDIHKLEAMNQLCRSICARPVPAAEARAELDRLLAEAPRYPWWAILAAHFLGAAVFSVFFGGSWLDALYSGVCGVALGVVMKGLERLSANLFIKTMAGGAVAALMALLLTRLGLGGSEALVTIGALMFLVPGVALTNAVRDVMVGDMVSGISKLGEALLIGVAIALGTGIALALGGVL